ncbi:hypothetical protein AHMF7605_21785 [Adhaeribacter arboris]|uniref:TonB C-terminal domain-containing protein n=1 Tax=Adhaeribacter arboris TaxID=2072846 RepID=A0A2T2YKA0_9BACT|nr:tetratricopeptide repeat protein [Adhaeribacter arboris]PSR55944.1 hypothetical protein AHMF7605_21785 [Adhaeribacter arboris]
MKNYILTFLLLGLVHQYSLAQIASSDLRQIKNAAQYKEGEEVLLKHFARSTRLTREMMSNPEVCTVLGVIKVKKSGTIEDIGTLNKVPKAFKDQFFQVAKLTDGKWLPTNDTSDFFYVVIPVQFKLSGADYNVNVENIPTYFHESIVVVGYFPNNGFYNYQEDSKYLARVEEFMAKGKNDKAIETMEYLLSRQPLNTNYYRKAIDLYEKAGRKEEAAYYTALMKVISAKS